MTVLVGDTAYQYEVARGDTLSKIARAWLDDPGRWPEICDLNRHRHLDGGARLTDCDLIYPGWQLRLPADATPPTTAKPAPDDRDDTPPPVKPEPAEPTPPAAPEPTHTPEAPDSTAPGTPPTVDTPAPGADAQQTSTPRASSDSDGITLPGGSYIPWTLAAAISAAAAMVWLQRRRRYQPGTVEPLLELPAPVATIDQQLHRTTVDTTAPARTR